MKRCLWAVGLLFLFDLSITLRNASACDLCKVYGFACSADNCEFVMGCESQSFGHNSYADCYTDGSSCTTGREFCVWASLNAPVCKEPVLTLTFFTTDAKAS